MSTQGLILIVDDDPAIAEVLCEQLEREGYECQCADNGKSALQVIRRHPPDLVLLDRMLPGLPGDEVARRLRSDPRCSTIPLIMLTGKGDESDELVGLALGADDYIVKPFSPKKLLARIAVHMRRKEESQTQSEIIAARSITLDRSQPQVLVDETPVQLSTVEYKILATLIAAGGHVLDDSQLLRLVYDGKPDHTPNTIATHVEGLRRKMGPAAGCIQAVSERAYAFCVPPGGRYPA